MIPKSGNRFSDKIMLKQNARTRDRKLDTAFRERLMRKQEARAASNVGRRASNPISKK
jgi:hypothetical protein